MNYKRLFAHFSLAFLSLASLWDLMWGNTWYYDFSEPIQYYLSSFEKLKILNPLIIWIVLGLTLLLTVAYFFLEKRGFKKTYLFLLFLTFNQVRLTKEWTFDRLFFPAAPGLKLGLLLALLGISIYYIQKKTDALYAAFQKLLVILSPLALYGSLSLLWVSLLLTPSEGPLALKEERRERKNRIVWLIFDEMDQRALFEGPFRQHYPNFHLFRQNAIYASQAHAAGAFTLIALPSLISGLELEKVRILPNQNLELIGSDQLSLTFKDVDHLFAKASRKGYRSAIKGFYHPYQRLFKPYLAIQEKWQFGRSFADFQILGNFVLAKAFKDNLALFHKLKDLMISPRQQAKERHNHLREFSIDQIEQAFKSFHQDVLRLVGNPQLDFVFIHCPYPHPPGYFSLEQNRFSHDPSANYFGNLKMADNFFGEICQELQHKGMWDETVIIVSSDHWLRESWCGLPFWYELDSHEEKLAKQHDLRVPCLIKGMGQKNERAFTQPFNTLLLHHLILEIMDQKIGTEEELTAWLQQHHRKFKLKIPLKDFILLN